MEHLAFAITILMMVMSSYEIAIESLEDVLVYPVEISKIKKREAPKNKQTNSKFFEFVEEKLIQHSQALEHLIQSVKTNEELTQQLLENLSATVKQPKLPEKVEVLHQTRRRDLYQENIVNPFVRLGQNIPKYGNLVKDIILKEIKNEPDPTPLVEQDPVSYNPEFLSRRSFSGKSVPQTTQNDDKISPWCTIALLCRRSLNTVCGYDDNYGYGRFDDVCHMIQVNCFWKYNFAVVPSCKPVL